MNLTGGIVLFVVIWFMAFLVALQIGPKSQADDGEIVPGTPASAPSDIRMKRKIVAATMVAVVLWSVIASVILSGAIGLRDIDWFNQLGDDPARPEN